MKSIPIQRKHLLAIILLTVLTAGAFGRTYCNSFLSMDDHVYIWQNPYIKDGLTWKGVAWAFRANLTQTTEFAEYWTPVTFLSRMTDISLFKLNPGMHHLGNLFFHVLNAVLLYFFIEYVSKQARFSFLVAALFALHPLHAEVIGWATARKDVLSLFFGLLTIHIYLRTQHWRGFWRNAVLALSFALSLMAKPMMITLPVLLLLIDAWQMGAQWPGTFQQWRRLVGNKWPLYLMIACYLPIPFIGQPQALEATVNPPPLRAIVAYTYYFQKLLVPVGLHLNGPTPELPLPAWKIIFSALFVLTVTGLAWRLRRKNIAIPVGWFWFLCASLPIIGLKWQYDRFMHMPMIGFWLMMVGFLELMVHDKRWLTALLGCYLAFFLAQSFRQIAKWKDDETLMHNALTYDKNNYSAHNVLGIVYGQRGDYTKAAEHLKEAIRIFPQRDKPYHNLAMVYELQGRVDEALKYYKKSLALRPGDFRTYNNIAILYVRGGRFDEAIDYFQKAIKLSPATESTYSNLAVAYFKKGDIAKAEDIARKMKSPELWSQLGMFLSAQGNKDEARRYFREALALDPNDQDARGQLMLLDYSSGE